MDEYWKSHAQEGEKDKKSVKIEASKMNEYGQFSLSTNLSIFHERLKAALQDEETSKFILKLSVLETTDPSYDDQDGKQIEFDWKVEDV